MGTWDYAYLSPIPAAENSVRRMSKLLVDPLCGWPQERLHVLGNERSPGDLADRLITLFDGISDVALFYYVGHGQIASDDQLCLGLVQSRLEPNRRAATSLRFSDVRQALLDSGAAVKIVILDCCFAGLAAAQPTMSGDVLDMTAGAGAYTMAATSAYTTAWYEDSSESVRPQTYFTKYLVDLVERGIPGESPLLRLDVLFRQLRDDLTADQRPVPASRIVNDARDFVFAYNAAPPQTHRDTEQELAHLSQRLAESEDRRAEADAQIRALVAEAAERVKEVARLKALTASAQSRTAEQQRELRDAIDRATRQLDDTKAAQAAAIAAYPSPPIADGLEYAAFITDGQQDPPVPGAPAHSEVKSATSRSGRVSRSERPHKTPSTSADRSAYLRRNASWGDAVGTRTVRSGKAPGPRNQDSSVPGSLRQVRTSVAAKDDRRDSRRLSAKWSTRRRLGVTGAIFAVLAGFALVVWILSTPQAPTLNDPGGDPEALAFNATGSVLADGDGSTAEVYLWNTANDQQIAQVPAANLASNGQRLSAVAFSPNGKYLAIGYQASSIAGATCLWSVTHHACVSIFHDPSDGSSIAGGVASLAFNPADTELATADNDGVVSIWNVNNGSMISQFPGDSAAISPNGKLLAISNSTSGTGSLYDLADKRQLSTFDTTLAESGEVSMAFTPDESRLAVAAGQFIYVLNLSSGKIVQAYQVPVSQYGIGVINVSFSPNGKMLVAGDANGDIYLWDSSTKRQIRVISEPSSCGELTSMALSVSGATIAAGCNNGVINLWATRQ
jgi:WD40 repeat protein